MKEQIIAILETDLADGNPITLGEIADKIIALVAEMPTEARLRKELIRCLNWIDKSTYWKEDNDIPTMFIVDEYLKTRFRNRMSKPNTGGEKE